MSEVQPYVDAWLAREPGMELAQVFVASAQRERYALWGALLHQLDEAAFELSDTNVSRTKLAWWAEELAAMAGGRARHPLARALAMHEVLIAVPAPDWHALAHAAIATAASQAAPADPLALLAQGAPYARVTARIEAQIFHAPARPRKAAIAGATPATTGAAGQPADVAHVDAAPLQGAAAHPITAAVAVHHVLRRLEHALGRDATTFAWPLNLRARHQAAPQDFVDWRARPAARAVVRDLCTILAEQVDGLRGAAPFRRAQAALDARKLRHLSRDGEKPLRAAGPATLWALWRAARRA